MCPGASAASDGFGGAADGVDELGAPLGRLGRAASVEAARNRRGRPSPDLEPAVVPTAGSVVQVLAAADLSRAFTASRSAGLVAGARGCPRSPGGSSPSPTPSASSSSSTGRSSRGATSSGSSASGKVRAAALMTTFGAELVGNQNLQQLKKHRGRAAFRHEEERRERLASEPQKAPADRGPVQGAGREHEREAGEPTR